MKITVKTKKGTEVSRLVCEKDNFIVGKGADCLVDLSGWRIAKQHALIAKNTAGVFVEPIDKKMGVLINDHKITGSYGPLVQDEVIKVGDYHLFVEDPMILAAVQKQLDVDTQAVELLPALDSVSSMPDGKQLAVVSATLEDEKIIALTRHWKLKVHSLLIKTMDLRRTNVSALNDDQLRVLSQDIIQEVLASVVDFPLELLNKDEIAKQVLAEAVGLGPLEDLLAKDDVSEVMVNAFDEIYFEQGGRLIKSSISFSDDKAVLSAIERIVSPLGRRIDESSPMVDARLKDGSRVNAIIPPLALKGPSITIRKFMQEKLTMEHLMAFGSMNKAMIDFLSVAVNQHLNIIISGGTGSGKTTLLNALSHFISEHERIVTIEDAAELKLNKPHVVSLEARPANQEGTGEVAIRDLVKNCLRMRPDRIVVGECRSGEALDMLQAMNTGHDGSMTTVHSNSPRDCVSRLEVLSLMSGMDLPVTAIREQIASAVHLIVQQTRFACGARKITNIAEVTGVEGSTVQISDIFCYQELGFNADGKTQGRFRATGIVPEFYECLAARGVAVDLSLFADTEPPL